MDMAFGELDEKELSHVQTLLESEGKADCLSKFTGKVRIINKVEGLVGALDRGYAPTELLLKLTADYYFKKYGICIRVCGYLELNNVAKEMSTTERQFFGLIGIHPGERHLHAVPFLFNSNSAGSEVLQLDTERKLMGLSKLKADFKFYQATDFRQADTFSCRTEALVILRNALLYIKHHGITSLDFLPRKESSSDEVIPVSLPEEWDYTNQVSHKGGTPEEKLVIRDFFSNQEAKREAPRTVAEFREKYSAPVTFWKRYAGEGSTWVTETTAKKINIFLLQKGRKNVERFLEV